MNKQYIFAWALIAVSQTFPNLAVADISGLPTNEADCLKTYELPIGDISHMTPEASCQSNEKLPIDNGNCREVYTKLQDVYRQAQNRLKQHCAETPKLFESFNACAANTASANCDQQQTNLQNQALTFVEEHRKNIQNLQTELENAKQIGVKAAEQLAENIKELEQVPATQRNAESPAAAEVGAKSTNQAINDIHSGQKAAELIQIISQVKNPSSISGDDVGRVDSLPAMEVLTGAQMAKDLKADLSEFDKKLQEQEAGLKSHSELTSKNVKSYESKTDNLSRMASAEDSANSAVNSAGAAAGVAGAAAGPAASSLGGSGSGGSGSGGKNSGESEYVYNNAVSSSGSGTSLGASKPSKSKTGTLIAANIDGKNPTGTEGVVNSTSASKSPGDRSALRDRLKQRIGAAAAAGESAPDKATSGANIKLGPDGKPKSAGKSSGSAGSNYSAEELSMLTPGTKLSGNRNFSLEGSETDASVQELIRGFEGELEQGNRGLASEQINPSNADDIGSENGADLFIRMKDVFERCLKRGCVSASRGSS